MPFYVIELDRQISYATQEQAEDKADAFVHSSPKKIFMVVERLSCTSAEIPSPKIVVTRDK